ncbi:glycosyltransferase family 4 protein [Dyadobacter jiangsuensis]|uniref:Glycosyltransferase involved in cell wall biosynthesis n=1 Tax=Dyadobacter jiangsuensis TaxID=1591085 RepID=A0A2P8FTS7_9BACT|nr:glycosyltransferase family 4 protein [Dyadobacter jiangsuensis]PSL25129.1 glycosyltransferase involved in cell wall biosynthesis [Dyadobacter jiangsuensis]
MKKQKLLYILHDVQIGGVEVAMLSALPELNRQFDLKVMVLGSIDANITSHLTAEEKACMVPFDYKLSMYPLVIPKMIRFILGFSPDVMICSLWRASLLGILAKKLRPQIRFVSFIHNTAFFHRFDRLFSQAAIRHADSIFTDSQATATFVREQFKPSVPIEVISFFTSPSPDFKPAPPFDNQDVRFMFLGRINSVKNLPLAIDTIRYLTDRGYNASLDIYGRNDGMLETVTEYIRTHQLENRVRFQGEVNGSKKLELFRNYNFLIQLSTNEGMAMSVAEAMQNGLVCFVTAVGEIPNYAGDMKTAIFADISTTETFGHSLKKLESVIADPHLYDRISTSSYEGFKTVGTYSESLIRSIGGVMRTSNTVSSH